MRPPNLASRHMQNRERKLGVASHACCEERLTPNLKKNEWRNDRHVVPFFYSAEGLDSGLRAGRILSKTSAKVGSAVRMALRMASWNSLEA